MLKNRLIPFDEWDIHPSKSDGGYCINENSEQAKLTKRGEMM